MFKILSAVVMLSISASAIASSVTTRTITMADHLLHVVEWAHVSAKTDRTFILLSGPVETWHSDTAWWAGLGYKLAEHGRVIALDRNGFGTDQRTSKLGYVHAAKDLATFIKQENIQNATVLAFASSNITLMAYFDKHPEQTVIQNVVMIDPDVLTPFSIARYQSDAKPFKDNLQKYLDYIATGKYTARVEQKNQFDREQLETLNPEENFIDWALVDEIFANRLLINQQQNLFEEIAMYGDDLSAVANVKWPSEVPLTVYDTDFEREAIEGAEDPEQKEGLMQWKVDGKAYYQSLVAESDKGRYIEVSDKAHLYHVSAPDEVVNALLAN